MRTPNRSARRRPAIMLGTGLVAMAMIAASCSKKDDGNDSSATTPPKVTTAPVATTATPATSGSTGSTTPSGASTASSTVSTSGASVPATSPATEVSTAPTEPAKTPVPGGKLVVSGEAEVANAWTPALMQCDSYCQERARSFFDPIAAFGADEKVHPYLAESITANADSSQWTVKLRSGINFTDGTPVNADAVIKNLQATGTSVLIAGALVDVAKVADPNDATKKILDINKVDDLTFTVVLGKNGDPNTPLSWPGFPAAFTTQWGLIASPKWLDAVAADKTGATAAMPVGSGPFIVQSYTPHDTLVVKRNPNYWQKDANGVQLPYLDEIDFKVIEDSQTAEDGLKNGQLDIFSTSSAQVISDFRKDPKDFPMTEQTKYVETNYILIDLSKPGPTSDVNVRCALSMAIDRQELIDLTEGGLTQIANGLFSPGQEGYLDDNGFDTAQNIDAAKALIDKYKKDNNVSNVTVEYGHTATAIGDQEAQLLQGYWSKIGVDTKIDVVPQDQFITNALLGVPTFFMYGWRNNAGLTVDQQNFWWNSASGTKDGDLSLNFGRINDPTVDKDLADARSNPDAAARQKDAEDINRTMAKNCYQIPVDYTLWGTPHKPTIEGLGETTLPDGTKARDGAGFSGQFWVNSIWIDKS